MALRSRFQGVLAGAVIGDCLGAYWETQSWKGIHPIEKVQEMIEQQIGQAKSKKGPVVSYTDDTALTFAVAGSLVGCGEFNPEDMARRMTEVFFADARRGYGNSISTVFCKLKESNYKDVYQPASQQFKGQGSCGNGSAMRISPVSLFGCNDNKLLTEVCTLSSKITHAHISGVNNAILQGMAIKLALKTKEGTLDPLQFVDQLLEWIHPLEVGHVDQSEESMQMTDTRIVKATDVKVWKINGQPSCTSRLQQIRAFLTQDVPPTAFEVQELLGHGVLAAEAVPCAIYAFLQFGRKSFKELIPYAISLGGDTDTIGSMAGAIGGAYLGVEAIPQDWLDNCEEIDKALSFADTLYDNVCKVV